MSRPRRAGRGYPDGELLLVLRSRGRGRADRLDLPHPSSLADEGRRILFTFIGVAIAVLVMFLADRLAKRTPAAQQPPPGQVVHGT